MKGRPMTTTSTPRSLTCAPTMLHAFLARLPLVESHARFAFRHLHCSQERDDAVADAVALVWTWYRRLLARGKDPSTFVVTLANFASQHVKAGRRLYGKESRKDVLSRIAQKRYG